MTKVETYLEMFSENGRSVFQIAAEIARKRAQYHIAEGHIIVALFQIAPESVASKINQKGVMPAQIITIAEKEILEIKPYIKGGIKIHPSAYIFFKKAMKFAKADKRSQIDVIDLIAALDSRIEDLVSEREEFNPILFKGFRRIKALFNERRRLP